MLHPSLTIVSLSPTENYVLGVKGHTLIYAFNPTVYIEKIIITVLLALRISASLFFLSSDTASLAMRQVALYTLKDASINKDRERDIQSSNG